MWKRVLSIIIQFTCASQPSNLLICSRKQIINESATDSLSSCAANNVIFFYFSKSQVQLSVYPLNEAVRVLEVHATFQWSPTSLNIHSHPSILYHLQFLKFQHDRDLEEHTLFFFCHWVFKDWFNSVRFKTTPKVIKHGYIGCCAVTS